MSSKAAFGFVLVQPTTRTGSDRRNRKPVRRMERRGRSVVPFPLTPALSLGERGRCTPLLVEPRCGKSSIGLRNENTRRTVPPLPWGEGRGEGEQNAPAVRRHVSRIGIRNLWSAIISFPPSSPHVRACDPQAVERLCPQASADAARVAFPFDLLKAAAPTLVRQP